MFDADDLTHKIMNLDVNDAMDEATFQDHLLLFKGLFFYCRKCFLLEELIQRWVSRLE